MAAQLQLVFDHGKRHEIVRMVDLLADRVDIVEIGYPELVTFGLDLVHDLHKAHPNLRLCVDAKVFHGGTGITRRCFEAGASIVSVLAYAPNPVIQQMVRHARACGGEILCDMDGVKRIGKRTAEVDALGVSYVGISSGYLMEHEYELHKPNHGSIFQVRPLEKAGAVKRNLIHAGLALGTGINVTNIKDIMRLDPKIVMVGRGVFQDPGNPTTNKPVAPEVMFRRIDTLRAAMA